MGRHLSEDAADDRSHQAQGPGALEEANYCSMLSIAAYFGMVNAHEKICESVDELQRAEDISDLEKIKSTASAIGISKDEGNEGEDERKRTFCGKVFLST